MKIAVGVTGPASHELQALAFEAMIASQEAGVQALARKARSLVLEALPGVVESVWPQQKTASYGTGPKKMSEHFTFFVFAKAHMSFGFYYGAELDDPDGLLEGTGARMRHMKIRSKADLETKGLARLLTKATTHRVPPLPTATKGESAANTKPAAAKKATAKKATAKKATAKKATAKKG